MKALKPTSCTRKPAGSCWKLPLATERMVVMTMLMTKNASSDKATQVQRLRTVPPRLLGRPEPRPANWATFYRGTVPRSQDRYE
jgi:hypothetical protein